MWFKSLDSALQAFSETELVMKGKKETSFALYGQTLCAVGSIKGLVIREWKVDNTFGQKTVFYILE